MRRLAAIAAALFLCLGAEEAGAVNMDTVLTTRPAANLSEYGLFSDAPAQEPASGVLPYDLITPLFTDYAGKRRFVYVPDGKSAAYDASEIFAFPIGTVLIKTFAYPSDTAKAEHGLHLIETRLLIHKEKGWAAYPYVWNEE